MRIDFRRTRSHQSDGGVTGHQLRVPRIMILIIAGLGLLCFSLWTIGMLLDVGLSRGMQSQYGLLFFRPKTDHIDRHQVHLLWVDEVERKVTLVPLPDQLMYESRLVGSYPLQSLHAAAKLQQIPTQRLNSDLSFFFQLPMIDTLAGSRNPSDSLRLAVAEACLARGQTATFAHCLHLTRLLSLPGTKIEHLSFPENLLGSAHIEGMQPLEKKKYGEWKQARLRFVIPESEELTIAVLNASGVPGAARQAAAYLSGFGFHPVRIDDLSEQREKGVLILPDSYQAASQLRVFLHDLLAVPVEYDSALTMRERSEYVFIIGREEAKAFTP